MNPSKAWLKYDDEKILREKLNEVILPLNTEDQAYLDKMIKYIDASFNHESSRYGINPGIAIAANQVGWNKRVIYIHFSDGENVFHYLLANPKIKSYSQSKCYLEGGEGCLSVVKKHNGIVPRRTKIIVEAFDLLNNKPIEITAENFFAINLQHEIDHLNGILYYDHINKENPSYIEEDWIQING